MERIAGYVLVNDINELKEKDVIWENEKSIRVCCMGVFHDLDKVTFPQTFKYVPPYEGGSCGDFWPCDTVGMTQAVKMQIRKYEKKIEDCKKVLDILKTL